MPHALFLEGIAHGRQADIEDAQQVVYWPNADGTFSLYPRSSMSHPEFPDHIVFVLANIDPATAIKGFAKA